MKKIALAAALVFGISAGSALAAPTAKFFGINVDLANSTSPLGTPSDFLVKGKYLISKDMAIHAGLGFHVNDSGAAANAKSTDFGFMGGVRKYFKTDDFAPFMGGKLQYLSVRVGTNDVTDLALIFEAGAEYFIGKQFSVEGAIGAGYGSRESQPAAGGVKTKATGLGTATYNTSVNFYF